MNTSTSLSGRLLAQLGIIVTGPVLDNARVGGAFVALVGRVFSAANTDTTFSHVLGRIPNGYIIYRNSAAGIVYDASDGTTSWTSTSIKLRSSATGTVSVLVF
jgi:hypothetical protein